MLYESPEGRLRRARDKMEELRRDAAEARVKGAPPAGERRSRRATLRLRLGAAMVEAGRAIAREDEAPCEPARS